MDQQYRGISFCKWTDLSKASKKERRLVIKASGFHETAWGGRSVVIGDDMPAEEWKNSITSALDDYPSPVCIMQEFMKPVSFSHPIFFQRL